MNKEVTEDIDKLKRESSGGTGKLSIKPMSDLIEPNSCVSPSPPLSVAEKAPPARTINGRRLVKYFLFRRNLEYTSFDPQKYV